MKLKLFIGTLIAAICLYYVFKGISFTDLWNALSHAELRWIAAALAIYTVGFWIRAIRWEKLMRTIHPIPARELYGPLMIGFLANNILPFRMGEFVRAQVTGTKFKISRTASLGSILLERLCDTISFLTTFLIVALFYPFPSFVEKGAGALAAACALAVISLLLISHHHHRFHELIHKAPLSPRWKERILDIVENFARSVSGMKDIRYVIEALLLSLVVWTIEGSMLYLISRAFSIGMAYPQSFFLLFFMGLSVTLPQAPGYVGTFEWFGVSALVLLGIPKEKGLPVILAIHGCQFIYIAVVGTLCLWSENISFSSILHNPQNS